MAGAKIGPSTSASMGGKKAKYKPPVKPSGAAGGKGGTKAPNQGLRGSPGKAKAENPAVPPKPKKENSGSKGKK